MAAKKRGLGMGLDALISRPIKAKPQNAETSGLREIPVADLVANPAQPRKNFDETALGDLAESIKAHGIISPLVVRDLGNGRYGIVAGERRFRAARLAGLKTVPVVLRDIADAEAGEIALIENIQRRDLTPVEEARAYEKLMGDYHLTQEALSQRVGRSRPYIANLVRLLKLPEKVLDALDAGLLSVGQARPLLVLEDEELALIAARRIIDEDRSTRGAEKLCAALKKAAEAIAKGGDGVEVLANANDEKMYLDAAADRLKVALGAPTKITIGKKKSRIQIEAASREELERIINLIASRQESEIERKKELLRAASKSFAV